MIPPNSTTAITPIMVSVVAALRAFGFWNEGTPLLIASTPVSAVQPEAKARTSSNARRPARPVDVGYGSGPRWRPAVGHRSLP